MFQRLIKGAAIFLAIIIALLTGFILFLHTATGKLMVRNKVQDYLQKKLKTEVLIANIDYRLPNWIALEHVVILDRKKDTLLSGGRLYVGLKLLQLLYNKVDITGVSLENINLLCRREAEDSVFNFQFILDAFASVTTKKPTKPTGAPLRLSVGQLSLNNVKLIYSDQNQHVSLSAYISDLSCLPYSLQPEKKVFRFYDLRLRNSRIILIDSSIQNPKSQKDTKNRGDPAPLLLTLKKMELQHVSFSYQQPLLKTAYNFQIDSLQLHKALLDVSDQSFSAGKLFLSHTSINLLTWIPEHSPTKNKKQIPSATQKQWKFRVDAISLNDNSFVYYNAAVPAMKGLDYQHINAQNLNLQTQKNTLDASGFSSEVNEVSLLFNNQIHVKDLRGAIRFSDSLLQVQDLMVAINQSQVTTYGDIVLPFKPNVHFASSPQFVTNLSLAYGDLLLIQPELKNRLPISLLPSDKIVVTGNFSGNLEHLQAKQFSLATSGKQLQLKGSIDINLEKVSPEITAIFDPLQLKKHLLSKNLLQQLQKEKVYLPEEIALSGKIQLVAERLITNLRLNSTFGQLQISGTATNIRFPRQSTYSFTLDAQHFETGKWIGLDSVFGKITARIFIKGMGIQKNNLVTTARLQLQSAVISGYPFTNIDVRAHLDRSEFNVKVRMDDPHLKTNLDLSGHISPDFFVHGTAQVKRADFLKLGVAADSLVYAGNLHLNANYRKPNKISAFIRSDSNRIFIHKKQIVTDSLSLTFESDTDMILIKAQAPFIDAQLSGNYPIKNLSSEITSIWRRLYPLQDIGLERKAIQGATHHHTTLNVTLKQDSLLGELFPALELMQPLTVLGRYTTEQKDSLLSIQLIAREIRYNKYEGHNVLVTAKAVDSAMQFSLTGSELLIGRNHLTEPEIAGHIQRGLLLIKGRINDSTGKEYYSANVQVKKDNDEMAIRFLDDPMLNHNKWKVSSDNLIRIVKQGYIINHLLLENQDHTISINTKDQQALSPIDIQIDSFDISHIFALFSQDDTSDVKGILNADISIQQPIGKVPLLTGDIRATNLAVFDIPIGNLRFHSGNIGDSLAFQGGLTGENRLGFKGSIHLTNGGIHLQTHLEKLNIGMVQALAKDYVSPLTGKITGDLQLVGSLDAPQVTGTIYLDSMAFALTALNTLYHIDKQELVIDYPDLRFEQFALADSAGHKLNVHGTVSIFSPDKKMDISIETKNFAVLNAAQKPSSSIYGTGIMDANVTIKGAFDAPIVEGNAYLHEKSHVHFVNTPKRTTTARKDGILFVNIDTLTSIEGEVAQPVNDSSAVARPSFKGLKYDLNLNVDKNAEFSVIIDPSTSDELVLKGDARLNAGLGENGNIGIEGVYNLQSGYYKMNNLLLRGRFLLVKGSSISFSGDPALAEADVTTEYIIEASPKGLLNYNDDENAAYSQRVSFAVIFMIKGPLAKPVLSFDIQLKEGKGVLKSSVKSDVEHALDRLRSDVSEMNKQVFSLLLTKRFSVTTGYNTLESSNLNANNALKEGVSSFLTEAMNQVADQLIKRVDVDVNMKTYKTDNDPISKTDLGVAMSKDLMQDRLVIRIEENFAMGNTSAPVKSGSQYIPDITSTYKLSKDGRFQLKGYQKNEYDAVVQGYFTEVGINFTIELSYDTFKELVRRRKNLSNEKK